MTDPEPYNTATFKVRDATHARELRDHLGDIVNVKDYGAAGDGATDDTAAIRAARDAAFGTKDAPHGVVNAHLNRAMYFPAGFYNVAPDVGPLTITNCVNVGGLVQLAVVSTVGLANGDMVYVRGVTGTTHANGSYRISDLTSTTLILRDASGGVAYNAAWTGGGTVCPSAVQLHSVHGARIYGDGKAASHIQSTVDGCACFSTNGFEYSHVEDISFGAGNGIAFDCNQAGGDALVNCQSNLFTNCRFGGRGGTTCDYGCALGMGQNMGSEMSFHHCYVATGKQAGLSWHNFNALAGTVLGGNFGASSGDIGGNIGSAILVVAGACPTIHGVSFQSFDGIDIDIQNGAYDAYSIAGCRSESENFVRGPGVLDLGISISSCCMTSPNAPGTGFFYTGGCNVTITDCMTAGGYFINGENASVVISNCNFVDATYLTDGGNENFRYLEIHPQPVRTITATSYTLSSSDGGHKLQFSNASPQTVTLPKNSDGSNRLSTGTKIEVQRTGTGSVAFAGASGVTIRSSDGLRLRAQYSCATLACDGSDLWTLSGDTAV